MDSISISKDTLEGMASILRGYGYEVSLKESEIKESDIKKPYIHYKFNKIRDLDLYNLGCESCLFLSEAVVEDFKQGDYIAVSEDVTIGYLWDHEGDVGDILIKTNRIDAGGRGIVEKLSNYDYVITLSDVFKLMDSNEEFYA